MKEAIMTNTKNENAKDPKWQTPVDLPGVKPEDYAKNIDSGRGSATDPVFPGDGVDPAVDIAKRRKQMPLHDEPIGGG
jgi:hypothetical protein